MATKKQAEGKPKRVAKKKGEAAVVDTAAVEVAAVEVAAVEVAVTEAVAIEVDAPPVARVAPAPDAIRARAFELWKARGGHALDNWLAAEWELRGEG